jgi:predicted ester cyclase
MKQFLTVAVAVTCMATACNSGSTNSSATSTDTSAATASMPATNMTEKNKQAALASCQGFTDHNVDAIMKDAAPDFTEYGDGSGPPVKGIDSNKTNLKAFFAAFPDIKGENLMAIAEGNHVAVVGDWSGTFKGAEFMGIKPTNKSFKIHDVDLFTFSDDGKITEHHSIQSVQTIFAQLGIKMKQ